MSSPNLRTKPLVEYASGRRISPRIGATDQSRGSVTLAVRIRPVLKQIRHQLRMP